MRRSSRSSKGYYYSSRLRIFAASSAVSCAAHSFTVAAQLLGFQASRNALFSQLQDALDVGEGRGWIVVVAHQSMIIIAFRCDLFNHQAHILHRVTALIESAGDIESGSLQGAEIGRASCR